MLQLKFPGFTLHDKHLGEIRNLYWHLRAIRPGQGAKRRKLYRLIAKHKAVLVADGMDPEELRLWCKQWCACYKAATVARYEAFLAKKENIFQNTQNE